MTLAPQMTNPFTGHKHRFPLIIGADPGAHKGYALADAEDIVERRSLKTPRIVALGTTLRPIAERIATPGLDSGRRPVWACVELQYAARVTSGEISADSIIKLAFRAGYMIRECGTVPNCEELFAATPHKWKCQLWHAGDTMRKDIFCEKVKRQLVESEIALLKAVLEPFTEAERATRILDVLDAIGISWALYQAFTNSEAGRDLEEWRVWPDRILPLAQKSSRQRKKLRI